MNRNDPANAPRLCPACRVAAGYWIGERGLCPRCAAVAMTITDHQPKAHTRMSYELTLDPAPGVDPLDLPRHSGVGDTA